ncbi:H/ACA ribonucleoprotein complex subunit 2-like protein [Eurytemora carolleeae]|uniref:H/ACA ribonucleoprotein complex subunit 2-like protein n=1 Tax=Eurytemora carolleeae TaxID=1294199 RepID=UPI000C779486|nr:H/ACA ribonucleoprotein complex subunit 2-like protein [Eurytemora carolleeae]|eukprot:XP_023330004.1 H/ACA ribonucleoprotein complex subunit 2-like protein [Eurytemora affinis]
MGKKDKSLVEEMDTTQEAENEMSYEEKLKYVSVVATPIASKKFAKKIYKLIKKGSKQKTFVRSGLKDVQSRIRKGERGIVIFAGDVTPVDVMIHMPGVCEDLDIPYVYTPSRTDLGSAMGVKRGCLMMLVREHADYKDLYDEVNKEIKGLHEA